MNGLSMFQRELLNDLTEDELSHVTEQLKTAGVTDLEAIMLQGQREDSDILSALEKLAQDEGIDLNQLSEEQLIGAMELMRLNDDELAQLLEYSGQEQEMASEEGEEQAPVSEEEQAQAEAEAQAQAQAQAEAQAQAQAQAQEEDTQTEEGDVEGEGEGENIYAKAAAQIGEEKVAQAILEGQVQAHAFFDTLMEKQAAFYDEVMRLQESSEEGQKLAESVFEQQVQEGVTRGAAINQTVEHIISTTKTAGTLEVLKARLKG